MSTLSCENYRGMLKKIRGLLKAAEKKYYTLYVGRLNPTKLGNF